MDTASIRKGGEELLVVTVTWLDWFDELDGLHSSPKWMSLECRACGSRTTALVSQTPQHWIECSCGVRAERVPDSWEWRIVRVPK